jgi:rubrerythrin
VPLLYIFATRAQINALRDQSEEERTRFQQRRHQKKYEIALALHLEAQRLALSAQKRIPLAQASRSGGKSPPREQMTIPVFPIIRGEREDIGLLSDDLQDAARDLVKEVDSYNSHIETLARTTGGPFVVDQDGDLEKKLIHLRDKAHSVAQKFNDFISKVRAWRCTRCGAFIDEILDTIDDSQRKRCPLCNNTTRTIGLTAAP